MLCMYECARAVCSCATACSTVGVCVHACVCRMWLCVLVPYPVLAVDMRAEVSECGLVSAFNTFLSGTFGGTNTLADTNTHINTYTQHTDTHTHTHTTLIT